MNVLAPGAIDTPFDETLFPAHDRPDVPLGRMGTAHEVAGVATFLLSSAGRVRQWRGVARRWRPHGGLADDVGRRAAPEEHTKS